MTVRWSIDPDRSTVWIEGSSSLHPIRSRATGLRGWIELATRADTLIPNGEVNGHIEIDVAGLSSGNPLVDRETRRRIAARRYPQITGDVAAGRVVDATNVELEGVIGFRGEVVEVEGMLTAEQLSAELMVLEGAGRFDVRWWGLRLPRLGLVRVHPEIDVRVRLELTPQG